MGWGDFIARLTVALFIVGWIILAVGCFVGIVLMGVKTAL
jgi:hypothetical protein